MKINIGLTDQERENIANGLQKLLADSYTLYVKTHNFHWNVTGPMFTTLHELFEAEYLDLAGAVDEIAERIRALGKIVLASYSHFGKLTSIVEESGAPSAKEMIQQLVQGQETVVRTAREVLKIADEANDQPTVDILTRRMEKHEKNAWMLRSLLE